MADIEAPDVDVVEQGQDVSDDAPVPEPVVLKDDVNEADALEQAHPVPLDEDR
jgi:hypothetical protein